MENILLVLPTGWNIKKIRYTQFGNYCHLLDADLIETPLDDPNSLLNYKTAVIKLDGPTGFRLIVDE